MASARAGSVRADSVLSVSYGHWRDRYKVATLAVLISDLPMAAEAAAEALKSLVPIFAGNTTLIFASGPSLPNLWSADRSIPFPSIAVNDAWKIAPTADILYATDAHWYLHHKGVPKFEGVKVGYGGPGPAGVIWLQGSGPSGFDERLGWVRHGLNSGYVAVHLAAQLGARRIVMVGFDMRPVNGKAHWFGDHPKRVSRAMPFERWITNFGDLAKIMKGRDVEVVNATPGSALKCFPFVSLDDELCQRALSA